MAKTVQTGNRVVATLADLVYALKILDPKVCSDSDEAADYNPK